jgi:hypothetical protein
MIQKKLDLINEQTSPLFRIMWVYNRLEPARKQFGNNICAFHIGNGYFLTVAHNLRTEAGIVNSIPEDIFQSEIQPRLNPAQSQLFTNCYLPDSSKGKRYLHTNNPDNSKTIVEIFKQINFDTRWLTLESKNICKPCLIVQFRNALFYNDPTLTGNFDATTYFPELSLNRHTFLLELKLEKTFFSNDIALYRMVNPVPEIVNKIPALKLNFNILDDSTANFYCLQSSSNSLLGRLMNNASIEGYADNWSLFKDRIGGDYVMDGHRYLIKGYFRFGSSGAPYLVFDKQENCFMANAIQSEASPIQLSINKNREGNFQYVNAIATPLNNIRGELEDLPHA